MKRYEVGFNTASIERTSSGFYRVTINSKDDPEGITHMFSTEADALREILSYAEIKD